MLAVTHGAEKVNDAALTKLGFPAVMVTTGTEIVSVREFLVTGK